MARASDPATHYDNNARAWRYVLGEDFHYGYFEAPDQPLEAATENLTSLMAQKGRLGKDNSVLDVGCGIGNPACLLVERYGCRVTGISTSTECVEHATRRAAERNCSDRASFVVADGMNTGLPGGSFDRVWVMESSHLMPRKDALLAECARVMRPGSRLALCDIILRRDLPLAEMLKHGRDFVRLRGAFGQAKMETLETYKDYARRAGIELTDVIDISDETYPTLANWRRRLQTNAAEVRGVIGDPGLEDLMLSCDILAGLWRERLLGYGLIAGVKR